MSMIMKEKLQKDIKLQTHREEMRLQNDREEEIRLRREQEEVNRREEVLGKINILMPEKTAKENEFSGALTEHKSARKRKMQYIMNRKALQKKANHTQKLNEAQKQWKEMLENDWKAIMPLETGENPELQEDNVVKNCIQNYLNMDFRVDWRNDAAFVNDAVRMEEITAKTEAIKHYLDRYAQLEHVLSEKERELFKIKLDAGIKISEYYKAQKQVLTNEYYKTHLNSDITKTYQKESTSQQKELAVLMRKAEYYQKTDNVKVNLSEKDLQLEQMLAIFSNQEFVEKNGVTWNMLFEETKDMQEKDAVTFIMKKEYEKQLKTADEVHNEKQSLQKYLQDYKTESIWQIIQDNDFIFEGEKEAVFKNLVPEHMVKQYQTNKKEMIELSRQYNAYDSVMKSTASIQSRTAGSIGRTIFRKDIEPDFRWRMEAFSEFFTTFDRKKKEQIKTIIEKDTWMNPVNKNKIEEIVNQKSEEIQKDESQWYNVVFFVKGNRDFGTYQDKGVVGDTTIKMLNGTPLREEFSPSKGIKTIQSALSSRLMREDMELYNKAYIRFTTLQNYVTENMKNADVDMELFKDIFYRISEAQMQCRELEQEIRSYTY